MAIKHRPECHGKMKSMRHMRHTRSYISLCVCCVHNLSREEGKKKLTSAENHLCAYKRSNFYLYMFHKSIIKLEENAKWDGKWELKEKDCTAHNVTWTFWIIMFKFSFFWYFIEFDRSSWMPSIIVVSSARWFSGAHWINLITFMWSVFFCSNRFLHV